MRYGILFTTFLTTLALALSTYAAPAASVNLDGDWQIILDKDNTGLAKGWEKSQPADTWTIKVPGVWEQYEQGAGYDGVGFYYKKINAPQPTGEVESRWLLRIGAANYRTEAFIDGQKVGTHDGGYLSFEFDVTKFIKPGVEQLLVLRVLDAPRDKPIDGVTMAAVPHSKEDWYYNFGGVYGQVSLACVPAVRVESVFVAPDLASRSATLTVEFVNDTSSPATIDVQAQTYLAPKSDKSTAVGAPASLKHTAGPGRSQAQLKLGLPTPPALVWSPEQPTLLECEISTQQGELRNVLHTRFGLREFTVKDGQFVLNGKPIQLRGVLYQPYYPLGLAVPTDPALLRKEVELMKASGINLLRAHIRLTPPGLLEACDELGMLVMAEPSIGWIPSMEDNDWQKYINKYQGDPVQLRQLCLAEVEGMVRRDRNHPSVIWWGMINEGSGVVGKDFASPGGKVMNIKKDMMQATRKLDPTRLITDDSAGWSNTWYKGHHSGNCMLPGQAEPVVYTDDHSYSQPLADHKKFGEAKDLVFLSEFGHGGMTDYNLALAGFGQKKFAQDYKQYERYQQDLARSLRQTGVKLTVTDVVTIFQAAQARDVRRRTEMCRLNPALDGYCLTQWQDVAHECSAGLVNVWGQPKPALAAYAAGNARSLIVLESPVDSLATGQPAAMTATMVGEPIQSTGVTVKLYDPAGKIVAEVNVGGAPGNPPATIQPGVLASPKVLADLAVTGVYRWKAEMAGAAGVTGELAMPGFAKADLEMPTEVVYVPAGDDKTAQALTSAGLTVKRDIPATAGAKIVTSQPSAEALPKLAEAAKAGATVILIEGLSQKDGQKIDFGGVKLEARSIGPNFLGNWYILPEGWVRNLSVDGALLMCHDRLVGERAVAPVRGEKTLIPDFDALGGYRGSALTVVPMDQGKLVVCQLKVLSLLAEEPAARYALIQMLKEAVTSSQ